MQDLPNPINTTKPTFTVLLTSGGKNALNEIPQIPLLFFGKFNLKGFEKVKIYNL